MTGRARSTAPFVLIVIGVAGSGKTTIGELLSEQLGSGFADADDFHTAESKSKMASGQPLNDADREPWLESLHIAIANWLSSGRSYVLACSALKRSYREKLRGADSRVHFVYLKVAFSVVSDR